MGFCWFFGFLAIVTENQSEVLRYIFVILVSSQGVAAFLGFFNRRVRDLWKNKLCGYCPSKCQQHSSRQRDFHATISSRVSVGTAAGANVPVDTKANADNMTTDTAL